MRLQSLIMTLNAGTIALIFTISLHQSAQAQTNSRQPTQGFYCDSSTSVPMTKYVNRKNGKTETWIRWTSNYFSSTGFDNLSRCQMVSERLEEFRQQDLLKYIKIGRENNQNILCVAREKKGKCIGIIYTLKPEQNPQQVLAEFMSIRTGKADNVPRDESGSLPVIDVSDIDSSHTNTNDNTDKTPSSEVPALREL